MGSSHKHLGKALGARNKYQASRLSEQLLLPPMGVKKRRPGLVAWDAVD